MSSGDETAAGSVEMATLARMDNRIDELEALCERQQATIEALQDSHDALEARTDMLTLVEDSEEMDGMQRSVTLLQHLQKKAEQESRRGRTESAAVDAENALEVLHYPGIDRTTIYSDFRRAERLVDDRDVCWYDGGDGARLVLDLENGDVPARFNGSGGGMDGC